MAVGATAAGVTVTVVVIPELSPHGEVPFTLTQYVVFEVGLTVIVFVVPAIGFVPTVDPVPHS